MKKLGKKEMSTIFGGWRLFGREVKVGPCLNGEQDTETSTYFFGIRTSYTLEVGPC